MPFQRRCWRWGLSFATLSCQRGRGASISLRVHHFLSKNCGHTHTACSLAKEESMRILTHSLIEDPKLLSGFCFPTVNGRVRDPEARIITRDSRALHASSLGSTQAPVDTTLVNQIWHNSYNHIILFTTRKENVDKITRKWCGPNDKTVQKYKTGHTRCFLDLFLKCAIFPFNPKRKTVQCLVGFAPSPLLQA